jgi:hypothetical protein
MEFWGCLLKVDLPTFRRVLTKITHTTTVQSRHSRTRVHVRDSDTAHWGSSIIMIMTMTIRILLPLTCHCTTKMVSTGSISSARSTVLLWSRWYDYDMLTSPLTFRYHSRQVATPSKPASIHPRFSRWNIPCCRVFRLTKA